MACSKRGLSGTVPDLTVLFMGSAMAGGISLTVLVSMLSARLTRRAHVDDRLLERLAHFVGWVLVGYLYYRFWDALSMTYTYQPGRTEGLQLLTSGPLSFNFWVLEMFLGALVPIIILLIPKLRQIPTLRMAALALVVFGVITYRWDLNISGQLVLLSYLPQDVNTMYTAYFPSLIEILAGAGVVAYGVMAITLAVKYLNLVDHRPVMDMAEEEVEASFAAAD
jgi:Ni/Fe-hydrogenase subunit HybB-like protein